MCTPLLVTLVTLVVLPEGVSPYGFHNCIQAPGDPGLFRCIQRFLSNVGAAVGDLPSTATSLNLSVNTLRQVPPRAFAHLPHLYILDLSHNQLEQLAPEAFWGLSALAHLDLAHNNMSVLAAGVFTQLGNLSTLRLDHNPLQKVAPGAFRTLAALSMLWLRGGQLSALEPVAVAVKNLTHLDLLDLCGNMLSTLSPGLPPTLRVLLLCNNSLGTLSGATPEVIPPGLRELDLSYNNISDPALLAHLWLNDLTSLHLAGNWDDHVVIKLPAALSGKVCGMCGNSNGYPLDDALSPDGKQVWDIVELGQSWKVTSESGQCQDTCDGDCGCCRWDQVVTFRTQTWCGKLSQHSGPFQLCHDTIRPNIYVKNCIYNLCASEGRHDVLCHALQIYVDDCQEEGVNISDWRTAVGCPLTCPPNSTYSSCGLACLATCSIPAVSFSCAAVPTCVDICV